MITIVFTLIGIIVGHILSYFSQTFLIRKQTSYRIAENIIEKRIQAYDNLYREVKFLRLMDQAEFDDNKKANEKIIRYPKILKNYETLANYYNNLLNVYNEYSQWYSNELITTFNFFQDYIMNCGHVMNRIPENTIINFAIDLHKDILKISSMFDKPILSFYTKECLKQFDGLNSDLWHKLPTSDTIKLLEETVLYKNYINKANI